MELCFYLLDKLLEMGMLGQSKCTSMLINTATLVFQYMLVIGTPTSSEVQRFCYTLLTYVNVTDVFYLGWCDDDILMGCYLIIHGIENLFIGAFSLRMFTQVPFSFQFSKQTL